MMVYINASLREERRWNGDDGGGVLCDGETCGAKRTRGVQSTSFESQATVDTSVSLQRAHTKTAQMLRGHRMRKDACLSTIDTFVLMVVGKAERLGRQPLCDVCQAPCYDGSHGIPGVLRRDGRACFGTDSIGVRGVLVDPPHDLT